MFRYERYLDEPRMGCWYSRDTPYPHPALTAAHRAIQHQYRVTFGGVGLAFYRDGRDSVAPHRDTDLRYCENTVIAILTLGARRPWLLQPRHSGERLREDRDAGDRSLTRRRRPPRDGRSLPGQLAARGAEGPHGRAPRPHLRAVALDVEDRQAGTATVVQRAAAPASPGREPAAYGTSARTVGPALALQRVRCRCPGSATCRGGARRARRPSRPCDRRTRPRPGSRRRRGP